MRQDMRVDQFSEKFKVVRRVLARHGSRVLDKLVARAVFPGANPFSAASMWSECKSEKRNFPADRREALFEELNKQTNGLFAAIHPDTLLESVERFGRALAAAGLTDEVDLSHISVRPLSERIGDISESGQLLQFLDEFQFSYQSINEFETAIIRLPQAKKETFARLVGGLIDATWDSGHIRSAAIASAVIHRMAWSFPEFVPDAKVQRRIDHGLNSIPAKRLSIVKPLCYVSADRGSAGPFIKNIERLITDAQWRAQDHNIAMKYYGGLQATAWQILKHGQERPLERRCQDVGRIIVMFPLLLRHRRLLDLAEVVKERTMKSLAAADVKRTLRGQAEDLMHAGSSERGS